MQQQTWPLHDDDELRHRDHSRIVTCRGVRVSTVIAHYKKLGEQAPIGRLTMRNNKPWRILYRWGDTKDWLAARGIQATGLAPERAMDITTDAAPAIPEVPIFQQNRELTAKLKIAEERARSAEENLLKMSRSQPGLLSGVEILGRAIPAEQVAMPAVYFLINGWEIVYVGQSIDLATRIRTHLNEKQKDFELVASIRCRASELNRIEAVYIQAFNPKYNQLGGKRYQPSAA